MFKILLVFILIGCSAPSDEFSNSIDVSGASFNLFGEYLTLGKGLPNNADEYNKMPADSPYPPEVDIWWYSKKYGGFSYDNISKKITVIDASFKRSLKTPITINGVQFNSSMSPTEVRAIIDNHSIPYDNVEDSSGVYIILPGGLVAVFGFNPNETPPKTMTSLYLFRKKN